MSWSMHLRQERVGSGAIEALPQSVAAENPAIAPPGGVTRPPPDPETGKVYKPGERLEKQARKFAQHEKTEVVKPRRKRRDYDAWIARALEDLELSSRWRQS